jgi:uncharacterized RDD family membrane protein YckC
MENEQEHLLADLELNLEQAGSGKRFANYIVDALVFYILIFCFGVILAILDPNAKDDLASYSSMGTLADRLITLLFYGIFMGLVEGIFKGKTLGKVITGTRAVNEDGSRIRFKTGFMRGLSRAVPFEVFSALGTPSYPWHDKWTKTYVIDQRRSTLL